MSSTQYEELYGVKLLDDLHNYFPALLYDTARFQTVRDVLGYITQSTRNRFDLFSFGQRGYMQTNLPSQPESPPLPRQRAAARAVDVSDEDVPFHHPRPMNTYADVARGFGGGIGTGTGAGLRNPVTASFELFTDDTDMLGSMGLMNLVNLLNGIPASGLLPRGRNPHMEDVVVNASSEQIEAASTRAFPEADTVCSICQDVIGTNEMGRKLNHCGHTFHIRCIDTWFSRNVNCPICRHDIRETGTEAGVTQGEEVN
jgi:hypothetical protein